MFFGKKLKELRLEYAGMGLRKFSNHIGMSPSQYSQTERGIVPPPPCKKWIAGMIDSLNIEHDSLEALELYNLWDEPFVMQKMNENVIVSPLSHKSNGTRLTTEEYININEHINSIGRKHNKVAEGYNKKRNEL